MIFGIQMFGEMTIGIPMLGVMTFDIYSVVRSDDCQNQMFGVMTFGIQLLGVMAFVFRCSE